MTESSEESTRKGTGMAKLTHEGTSVHCIVLCRPKNEEGNALEDAWHSRSEHTYNSMVRRRKEHMRESTGNEDRNAIEPRTEIARIPIREKQGKSTGGTSLLAIV